MAKILERFEKSVAKLYCENTRINFYLCDLQTLCITCFVEDWYLCICVKHPFNKVALKNYLLQKKLR